MDKESYIFNKEFASVVAKFESAELCIFELKDDEDFFSFQYIKRDISDELTFLDSKQYFDIITPFDYGGFYFTSKDVLEKGLIELERFFKKENIVSGFFRLASLSNQNYGILGKHIDLLNIQDHIVIDLKSQYEKEFSKRKLRNIKNAKKLEYRFIQNDVLDNFYDVYIDSMQRIGSSEYFKFDKNLLKDLMKFGQIFSIFYENKTVTSILIIEDKNDVYYFLGGTLDTYLKDGFNSLLFDLVCQYYTKSKNLFYLGGGQDGLYQYKKEFSNKTIPFYIGKKIFNKDIYDKLLKQTNRQTNDFFPQYRKKII